LNAQFGDDRLEQLGVKDAGGLAEAAQTGQLDAEFPLDLAQVTGLNQAAQAADDGRARYHCLLQPSPESEA
jgi:hypothetical protein